MSVAPPSSPVADVAVDFSLNEEQRLIGVEKIVQLDGDTSDGDAED